MGPNKSFLKQLFPTYITMIKNLNGVFLYIPRTLYFQVTQKVLLGWINELSLI
jgi:hypothetical protein